MGNFRWNRLDPVKGCNYFRLEGDITEDNDLDDVSAQMTHLQVVLELRGIQRINSPGVREWVNWLGRVRARGKQIFLVECSRAVVSYINMVDNFVQGTVVHS